MSNYSSVKRTEVFFFFFYIYINAIRCRVFATTSTYFFFHFIAVDWCGAAEMFMDCGFYVRSSAIYFDSKIKAKLLCSCSYYAIHRTELSRNLMRKDIHEKQVRTWRFWTFCVHLGKQIKTNWTHPKSNEYKRFLQNMLLSWFSSEKWLLCKNSLLFRSTLSLAKQRFNIIGVNLIFFFDA